MFWVNPRETVYFAVMRVLYISRAEMASFVSDVGKNEKILREFINFISLQSDYNTIPYGRRIRLRRACVELDVPGPERPVH